VDEIEELTQDAIDEARRGLARAGIAQARTATAFVRLVNVLAEHDLISLDEHREIIAVLLGMK
jgi:hypothetical protein